MKDTALQDKVLIFRYEDKFQDALIASLNMSNTLLLKYSTLDDDTEEEVLLNDVDDDSGSIPDVSDPYDAVYANMPEDTHMLEPVENCPECNAEKFEFEPPRFCCRSGKIKLSTPDTPPELMRLWSSSDADARHFRANNRFFNGHFSFTSLYC